MISRCSAAVRDMKSSIRGDGLRLAPCPSAVAAELGGPCSSSDPYEGSGATLADQRSCFTRRRDRRLPNTTTSTTWTRRTVKLKDLQSRSSITGFTFSVRMALQLHPEVRAASSMMALARRSAQRDSPGHQRRGRRERDSELRFRSLRGAHSETTTRRRQGCRSLASVLATIAPITWVLNSSLLQSLASIFGTVVSFTASSSGARLLTEMEPWRPRLLLPSATH